MIERVEGRKSAKSVHLDTTDRRRHDDDSQDDLCITCRVSLFGNKTPPPPCGWRRVTRAGAVKHRVILPGTANEWRLLTSSKRRNNRVSGRSVF